MSENPLDSDNELLIQVRSPSLNETLDVTVKLNETVLTLKKSIQLVHPQHPITENQRIIYSGKLLSDEETILSVVKKVDAEIVPTFHLVVKPSLQTFKQPTQQTESSAAQQPVNTTTGAFPLPPTTTAAAPPPQAFSLENNHINMNVPAYPSVLPGGYQVVAINGQYYLAPVLVPSQPLPQFQQNTPPVYHYTTQPQLQQPQPEPQAQRAFNPFNAFLQPFAAAAGAAPQPQQLPLDQLNNNNNGAAAAPARPAANVQRAASIWLALKLVIVLFMVCQDASIERIFIFHTIAFIFFLYQTGRLRFVLRRVRAEDLNNRFRFAGRGAAPPPPQQQQQQQERGESTGVNHNNDADNLTHRRQNNGEGSSSTTSAAPVPEQPARPPTLLDTFKRGAYTFFASLWPQYNQDPRIAQAFENNDQREGLDEF